MAIKKTKKTKTNVDEKLKLFKIVESDILKKGDKLNFELRGPVVLMASKIKAFFKEFSDVSVDFDEENSVVYIYSTDYDKSDALNRFIVRTHEFGGLKLDVKIVDVCKGTATVLDPPSYTITDEAMVKSFNLIFKCSPVKPDYTAAVDNVGMRWNFFEFPNYAVTYQADSLANIRGYDAIMIADAVKEIFTIPVGYQISTYAYVEQN